MTPLAYQIVKELTLPLRERTFSDAGRVLPRMSDIHCFEVTAAIPAIMDCLTNGLPEGSEGPGWLLQKCRAISDETLFLPAPNTWVEFRRTDGGRTGLHCCIEAGEIVFRIASSGKDGFGSLSAYAGLSIRDDGCTRIYSCGDEQAKALSPIFSNVKAILIVALAFINSPRIIGRRQHMPHRGLERKLVARRAVVGKFPLHAWTEIQLHITPPRDASSDKTHEAHLTGERALHFCRAHLRIRLGKLEVVRGHWRGDAALGIRRSRYVLKADRSARS